MQLSRYFSVRLPPTLLRIVLTTSAAYLRLHGVDARKHPVFIELTRVKQYFQKIKTAEAPPAERNLALDKGAASRFIKAGLVSGSYFETLQLC